MNEVWSLSVIVKEAWPVSSSKGVDFVSSYEDGSSSERAMMASVSVAGGGVASVSLS